MIHFQILICIENVHVFRNYHNNAKIVKQLKNNLILIIIEITEINIIQLICGTIVAFKESDIND
jgi:hypothetical protein